MLSFLEFDGKPLRSTLMDVIALEEQGMSNRELMQKNKLEVVAKNTFMTLSPDFNQPYKQTGTVPIYLRLGRNLSNFGLL